eukprot:CAMPEP_0194316496 /NCGR_PEP_ID=MMETSP0171-20130528/13292_1 /TAXON_ID=218684 /ORGANISM="Corethron pennatum, Strain L29A3" /LENGTH=348 /DNA_ID=CAMNT_0039072755 /DNA_START=105 /DNA_END=1151 /DNA_ORIENTATION=+
MRPTGDEIWIYHERQVAALCGQHALNNLSQNPSAFSVGGLASIAEDLDGWELNYMAQNDEGGTRSKDYLQRLAEGSGNVDAAGNFSIQVLRAALENRYGLGLPNIRQQGVGDSVEVTDVEGFICNRHAHWFAIRKVNGRFWNLDSTKERPQQISHFNLATEIAVLQEGGYSVFCVVDGALPPVSTAAVGGDHPEYWWKEADLLRGKGVNGATDPWKSVGSGMRLDGKVNGSGQLSEDEMLQMAIDASMRNDSVQSLPAAPLKDEPPPGPGVIRIQFRLPDVGRPVVRRFSSDETVRALYLFSESKGACPPGKSLDLLAGFPPKNIIGLRGKTIAEAGLDGESVQARYS